MNDAPALLQATNGVGPDFICVGAQKAGTRWLFDQVNLHADFWMPHVKELHYLDHKKPNPKRTKKWRSALVKPKQRTHLREIRPEDRELVEALVWLQERPFDLESYAKLFNPKGARLSGDITPTYAVIAKDRARSVRARFPEARVVYLARDPVERFWSQHCMRIRHGLEVAQRVDFSAAAVKVGVQHSTITKAVARWRLTESDDRFSLYFFDDLIADAASLRERIFRFIGADPGKPSGSIDANFNRKGDHKKIAMPDGVRDKLIKIFSREIRKCAAEFGGAAETWKAKYGL